MKSVVPITDAMEEEMLTLALPYIKKLCYRRWLNFAWEDRIAEASYFFICASRSLPINSGHFMKDFTDALIPYMDGLNRKAPSRFYRYECSLDHKIITRNGDGEWSLYETLVSSHLDESAVFVNSIFAIATKAAKKPLIGLNSVWVYESRSCT